MARTPHRPKPPPQPKLPPPQTGPATNPHQGKHALLTRFGTKMAPPFGDRGRSR